MDPPRATPAEEPTPARVLNDLDGPGPRSDAYKALLSVADADQLAVLPQVGLILVAPETFALGATTELIDCVARSGFFALDFAVAETLDRREIRSALRPDRPVDQRRWGYVEQRFTMGPSAALLVGHASGEPIAPRLSESKGARIPRVAARGTWRRQAGAVNGILNLVHTADGPEKLLSHVTPFLAPERVAVAASRLRAIRLDTTSPIPWPRVADALTALDDRPSTCEPFFTVYFDAIRRLLAPHRRQKSAPALNGVDKVLARAGAHTRAARLDYDAEELAVAMREIRRVADASRPDVGAALHRLLDPEQAQLDPASWPALLERMGVSLGAWQRMVMVTTMHEAHSELPPGVFDGRPDVDA